MYVFIKSEDKLWTVGFFHNDDWYPESDHDSPEDAARRVHYLNGGSSYQAPGGYEEPNEVESMDQDESPDNSEDTDE